MSDTNPPKKRHSLSVQRLRPDNFTPPKRTPWGGRRIVEVYKSNLGIEIDGPVGESWEVSTVELISSLMDGTLLSDAIAADPVGWIGSERAEKWGGTGLLLKLLDTSEPLSVQIHPDDMDPQLSDEESGKPEAWYIVHAEKDAGIYLGLKHGVDESEVRDRIESGGNVAELLRFIPVNPGDFLMIDPGTPHAIGAGLTLIEPQRVLPARRGITYRYWDWNRRYKDGRPDANGTPRELHVERALQVTDWNRDWDSWLKGSYRQFGVPNRRGPAEAILLSDRTLGVQRLSGSGSLEPPPISFFRGLTVIEGAVTIAGNPDKRIAAGESAAIPACVSLELNLEQAHALLCWIA